MSRITHIAAALAATGGLLLAGSTVAGADTGSLDRGGGSVEQLTGSLGAASSLLGSGRSESPGRLQSVDNFRDVAGDAGDGYAVTGGGSMAQGVVYRSNKLQPDDADLATLDSLHLTADYDLRTDAEIASPFTGGEDILPEGTEYVQIPIDAGDVVEAVMSGQIDSADAARDYMRDMYRGFVRDADTRDAFGELLTDLARTGGPQVLHCSQGKDRTGWAAMLLQHIAGVPAGTIMDDYLLTNEYSAGSIQDALDKISLAGFDPDVLEPMLTVDDGYLQAGLDAVDDEYGDLDTYLLDGLGLSQDVIDTLNDKLVAS